MSWKGGYGRVKTEQKLFEGRVLVAESWLHGCSSKQLGFHRAKRATHPCDSFSELLTPSWTGTSVKGGEGVIGRGSGFTSLPRTGS